MRQTLPVEGPDGPLSVFGGRIRGRHPNHTATRFVTARNAPGGRQPPRPESPIPGICLLAPCAAKVACTVRGRGKRVIPARAGVNRLFQSMVGQRWPMSVCEQETGVWRKCRNTLSMGKCGESPHRGTSGNLVTRAPWDGCPCLSKYRRRLHGRSHRSSRRSWR